MNVAVITAGPEQEPVLANLLELYAYDFSEFVDLTLGHDGRFGYKHLPLYWSERGRHAFIIKADNRLAGFALVRRGPGVYGDADVWDVAEFFILRGFRRQGVGSRAAWEIWSRLKGRWEVRVLERNQRAKEFWRRTASLFLGEAVEPSALDMDGRAWHVFSFESNK